VGHKPLLTHLLTLVCLNRHRRESDKVPSMSQCQPVDQYGYGARAAHGCSLFRFSPSLHVTRLVMCFSDEYKLRPIAVYCRHQVDRAPHNTPVHARLMRDRRLCCSSTKFDHIPWVQRNSSNPPNGGPMLFPGQLTSTICLILYLHTRKLIISPNPNPQGTPDRNPSPTYPYQHIFSLQSTRFQDSPNPSHNTMP